MSPSVACVLGWLPRPPFGGHNNNIVSGTTRLMGDREVDQQLVDRAQRGDRRALEQLPDDLRTAITLREIEGLSYEEIANVMNCPIGTVRSRIFRARESIAAELRPLLGTDATRRW